MDSSDSPTLDLAPAADVAVARRVVILSSVVPHPVDGGNKVVLAGLVRYFAARYGARNVHWIHVGPPTTEPQPDMVVHDVPRPSTGDRVRGVVRHAVLGRRSLQEAVLWSAATAQRLRTVLAELSPDLLVVDTVRMGQYLADPAIAATAKRTVCYLDDLYSERYRAMIELRRTEPDVALRPLASFAAMVPRQLRWLTEWAPTQRAILSFESRRVGRSELRTALAFDHCLLVNENEVARLSARVADAAPTRERSPRVSTVRPLARPLGGHRGVTRTYQGRADYLMVGVMSGPHNEIAVRWLLTEVMPHLREMVPDARIDLVGRDPSEELRALARETPGVRVHGFVPDLEPFLTGACAILNPPRYASGIKLKVISALTAGVPVVSTTPGADGIITGPEQGVVCADEPADFARAMAELRDPGRNAAVAEQARRHYATWFSEDAVFRHYDEVVGGAVGVPEPRIP